MDGRVVRWDAAPRACAFLFFIEIFILFINIRIGIGGPSGNRNREKWQQKQGEKGSKWQQKQGEVATETGRKA